MKKYVTLQNMTLIIALSIFIIKQAPIIATSYKNLDKTIKTRPVKVIDENHSSIQFPPHKKVIAFFWMTTCTPCKLEMLRLRKSVESGEISKDEIYAINPFEQTQTIKKFLKKNSYPFTFIEDNDLAYDLGIQVTPTTIFLNKTTVKSFSTGISLTGIYEEEKFLEK